MTTSKEKLLTAEDLLRLNSQGVRGELIRGVLCETRPTGMEHGEIAVALSSEIRQFIRPKMLGRVAASDTGVLLQRAPDTVREPDVAYISAERLPLDIRVRGYLEVVPDLVAEIVSPNLNQSDNPSNNRSEINDKTAMWLSHGVAVVWEVYPESRTVTVVWAGSSPITLTEDDTLDGGDVLPGFSCPVRAIFDP